MSEIKLDRTTYSASSRILRDQFPACSSSYPLQGVCMNNYIISQWLLENSEFKSPEILCEAIKARLTELNPDKVQNNVEIMLSQGITTNWLKKHIPKVLDINPEDFLQAVELAKLENEKVAQEKHRKHREMTEPFPYINVIVPGMSHGFSNLEIYPILFPKKQTQIIRLTSEDVLNHKQMGTLQQHFHDLVKLHRKHFIPAHWLELGAMYEAHVSVDESYRISDFNDFGA